MTVAGGIDGTKAGWAVAIHDGAEMSCFGAVTLAEAFSRPGKAVAIGIDMPIGFLAVARRGGRECERLARKSTLSHPSSIFSSPVREALRHQGYNEACSANRASSPLSLGISKQAHALFPKMNELDLLLRAAWRGGIVEVHPELSFSEMLRSSGDKLDLLPSKRKAEGRLLRRRLLEHDGFGDIGRHLERSSLQTMASKADDLLDACAAAWTARRWAEGRAIGFPSAPEIDERGLPMQIWA